MRTSERRTPADTSVPAKALAKKKRRVPAAPVDWTVMIYMVGDNNLEKKCKADLKEIERAGSSENVTVIVQTDLGPSGGSTKRYVIKPHSNKSLEDDVDAEWPETRPEVLEHFLHWSIKYHPAKRYMLLLWGHGRALDSFEVKKAGLKVKPSSFSRAQPKTTDEDEKPFFIVCPDDQARHAISNKELRNILASVGKKIKGGKIHVLGMVACLMGMFEMCYELRDGVHYMIASESLIPSASLPFDKVIPFLIRNPKMNEEDLCRTIVREFKTHYSNKDDLAVQLSAFDLTKADELRKRLDNLANLLRTKITDDANTLNAVLGSHFQTQRYDEDQFFDLYDFCYMLKQNCLDEKIGNACQRLMQVIGDQNNPNFVVASEFNGDAMQFSYGLAIYFPWGNVNEIRYKTLRFAGAVDAEPRSTWLRFLNTYVDSISKIERGDRQEPDTAVAAAEWLKDAPPHLKNGDKPKKNTPTVNIKKLLEAAAAAEWLKDAPPHLKNGDKPKKNMPTVNTKKLLEVVAADWLKDAPPRMKNGKGKETRRNLPTVNVRKQINAVVAEWMKNTPPHLKGGEETRKKLPTVKTKKAGKKGSTKSHK